MKAQRQRRANAVLRSIFIGFIIQHQTTESKQCYLSQVLHPHSERVWERVSISYNKIADVLKIQRRLCIWARSLISEALYVCEGHFSDKWTLHMGSNQLVIEGKIKTSQCRSVEIRNSNAEGQTRRWKIRSKRQSSPFVWWTLLTIGWHEGHWQWFM